MVRRAAVPLLGLFPEAVQRQKSGDIRSLLLEDLVDSSDDQIRMALVPVLWSLRGIFMGEGEDALDADPQDAATPPKQLLVDLAQRVAMDICWRVRMAVASSLPEAVRILPPDAVDRIGLTLGLLNDLEGEVRAEAARTLPSTHRALFVDLQEPSSISVPGEFQEESPLTEQLQLLRELLALASDEASAVRLAVARSAPKLALGILSASSTATPTAATTTIINSASPEVQELLKALLADPLVHLLHDRESSVRLALIDEFASLVPIVGLDGLVHDALLPAIRDLHNDPVWRIRLAIIQHMPLLARFLSTTHPSRGASLGVIDTLMPFMESSLRDAVFAVRRGAAQILATLYHHNLLTLTPGSDEGTTTTALDFIRGVCERLAAEESSYLLRQMSCIVIQELAHFPEKINDYAEFAFSEILERLTRDPVPNARSTAWETLRTFAPKVIRPIVSLRQGQQFEDDDEECREQRRLALALAQQ